MTETTLAPLPAANPGLNAALAAVQAEYPKVAKGKTADTGTYSYDYADLASISETVLPLLGRNGLAFIAKPTRNSDGDFVLAYSLVHKSGEREDGQYPLPSSGNAQALGSAITYARRYSLCAITGIAPGGEDDDGAAASQHETQASRPRRQQAPARSTGGNVQRPAASAAPEATGELDEEAQPFAEEASQCRTVAALSEVNARAREARKLAALIRNPATGGTGGLGQYIAWLRHQLEDSDAALRELTAAAEAEGLDTDALDARVKAITGAGIEDATPAQLRQAATSLSREPVPA